MRGDHLLLLGGIERAGVGHQQHHPGQALRMVLLHHRLIQVPVDTALGRGEHLGHRGAEGQALLLLLLPLTVGDHHHHHGIQAGMEDQGGLLHPLLCQDCALEVPVVVVVHQAPKHHHLCHHHRHWVAPGVGVAGKGGGHHCHHHHPAWEESHEGVQGSLTVFRGLRSHRYDVRMSGGHSRCRGCLESARSSIWHISVEADTTHARRVEMSSVLCSRMMESVVIIAAIISHNFFVSLEDRKL